MEKLTVESYAKINLTLEVIGKRKDGFHNIESVIQEINLHDFITLKKSSGLIINCNRKELENEDNLAFKAANMLRKEGLIDGAEITLIKNIPVASGLGGGSSNAAAVTKGLNELYNLRLKGEQMESYASGLGSDAPFFLYGGTRLAVDRGETTRYLPSLEKLHIILVPCPMLSRTSEAYSSFRDYGWKKKTQDVICALHRRDIQGVVQNLYNDFEKQAFELHPGLNQAKEFLKSKGALGALMAGSGFTIYGLFDKKPDIKGNFLYATTR